MHTLSSKFLKSRSQNNKLVLLNEIHLMQFTVQIRPNLTKGKPKLNPEFTVQIRPNLTEGKLQLNLQFTFSLLWVYSGVTRMDRESKP